jgi:hypothetical protein
VLSRLGFSAYDPGVGRRCAVLRHTHGLTLNVMTDDFVHADAVTTAMDATLGGFVIHCRCDGKIRYRSECYHG